MGKFCQISTELILLNSVENWFRYQWQIFSYMFSSIMYIKTGYIKLKVG